MFNERGEGGKRLTRRRNYTSFEDPIEINKFTETGTEPHRSCRNEGK